MHYLRDPDGIVVLTVDDPAGTAHLISDRFRRSLDAAVTRLESEGAQLTGVVVTFATTPRHAVEDLRTLAEAGPEDAAEVFAAAEDAKASLRRLERLGRPVVAAVNGAALGGPLAGSLVGSPAGPPGGTTGELGGGLELALACHHRVAVDDPRTRVGLPEVTLGLLPGAGGLTRVVRLLGLATGLTDVLLRGTLLAPAAAREKGLIDELVADPDDLLPAAKEWILRHRDDPDATVQPWDRPGYRMPGGSPSTPELAAVLPAFPATLRKQLKGAPYPAPRAILSAGVEGASVDFDTASRIESRYLTRLVADPTSTNLVQLFLDLHAVGRASSGRDREEQRVRRLGVVGAGTMGAGIAYAAARSGIDVVLEDLDPASAARGRSHSEALLDERVLRGRLTPAQREEVLARITPTGDLADLAGCDAVIEAVFEDPALKARVYGDLQDVVRPGTLLASNTSTLPVSGLASAVRRPEDVVGMHFFSPVDRVPVIEVVRGAETSPATVARAVGLAAQLRKTPILVNDGRGFFTSRVLAGYLTEALALLEEGVDPQTVERAATTAGFPSPPLALLDEVSLTLTLDIRKAAREAAERAGTVPPEEPGTAVVDRMLELARPGRAAGSGFYDYPVGVGKRLWPGLRDQFGLGTQVPLVDVQERYLFRMALETARCFQDGVIDSAAAANVASVKGIGFPAVHGGAVQYMQGYDGASGRGLRGFVAGARRLGAAYGDRFTPPPYLLDLLDRGQRFPE